MDDPHSWVPRRFTLCPGGFPGRVPAWRRARAPLYFATLGLPLFWFCFLVYEMLKIAIMFDCILPWSPTRGLKLHLSEWEVRPAHLVHLEKGATTEPPLRWALDHGFQVVEVAPGGQTTWRQDTVDLSAHAPAPWNSQLQEDELERLTVFVRPLPGTTYGDVVGVLDWLCRQEELGTPAPRIEIVRCEEYPEDRGSSDD